MPTPVSAAQLVDALNWRYATKKFDPTKTIPPEQWHALEQALILAPSSYGLQPWKFYVITDPAVKAKLPVISWRQTQPLDASHTVVFTVRTNLGPDHVDKYVDRVVEVRGVTRESLVRYNQVMVDDLARSAETGYLDHWQTHQIYIALGQFMAAAALLGIDTCPMEGIEREKYDELLGLTGTDYKTVVVCPAGYRAETDKYASIKKVRFDAKDVIVRL